MILDSTAPRILIAGTSHISNEDETATLLTWSRSLRRHNPETEILLLDRASPRNPQRAIADINIFLREPENTDWRDAFTTIADYAVSRDFEWLAFIDTACHFELPVAPFFEKLARIGVLVAAIDALCPLYFISLKYLALINYRDAAKTLPELFAEELFYFPRAS